MPGKASEQSAVLRTGAAALSGVVNKGCLSRVTSRMYYDVLHDRQDYQKRPC